MVIKYQEGKWSRRKKELVQNPYCKQCKNVSEEQKQGMVGT